VILMVMVTAANVTDREAARIMLPRLRARFRELSLVWADGGYTGRLVDWAKEKLQLTLQIVKRSDDMTGFVVLPRRWLVERSLGWLMRSRRLVRDFEASRFQRGVHLPLGEHAHGPPTGPNHRREQAAQLSAAGAADALSHSRSSSRFALDRTPSILAGTNSSPSRAASSFADTPSPSPDSP
jgi:transposase